MTPLQNTTDQLNHLLEICLDGEKGFATASKAIENSPLKAEFMQYSLQRRGFANDLKAVILTFGEVPPEHGTLTAALHRGWISLMSMVRTNDVHAILAECERNEKLVVAAYQKALSDSALPNAAAQLLMGQYDQVQRVYDRIKLLGENNALPAKP